MNLKSYDQFQNNTNLRCMFDENHIQYANIQRENKMNETSIESGSNKSKRQAFNANSMLDGAKTLRKTYSCVNFPGRKIFKMSNLVINKRMTDLSSKCTSF